MKIIAFDQSTKITGVSIWENSNLCSHHILTSNIKENNPIARMWVMRDKIAEMLDKENPDYVVIEAVQFQRNYNTYSQLSQLQGVIFSVLFDRNLPFRIIEATAWKKHCGIKGQKRAEQKAATIQMVKDTFNIKVSEDEADAIGIGLWAINNICIQGEKNEKIKQNKK